MITGMSGAGRSTALKTMEDFGYLAIDNLPMRFIPAMLTQQLQQNSTPMTDKLAIGLSAHTLQTDQDNLFPLLEHIRQCTPQSQLLFLTADDDILLTRYSETRRKHPLALDRPVLDGIAAERKWLQQLRLHSDDVLDTSHLSVAEFRQHMKQRYGQEAPAMSLSLMSFSYAVGLPRNADLVFDVRFLRNPHYDNILRPQTGLDDAVGHYIEQDTGYQPFMRHITHLLQDLLPAYQQAGKSYLTIAVGCTGGKHRSVYVTRKLAEWCEQQQHPVWVQHRDIPL